MEFDFLTGVNTKIKNFFYKKLLDEIPDLMYQMIIKPDNSYLFPFISASFTEIFHITKAELKIEPQLVIFDRIHPDDKKMVFDSLVESKRKISRWEVEFRIILPNKDTRWVKTSSSVELLSDGSKFFYGRIYDVTSVKLQEIKLKISEERLQFAVEASMSGVWDWDMRTNEVFYSSQSMEILGQTPKNIYDVPEKWDRLVHPEDLEKYYSDIKDHFDFKTPLYENYHRVKTVDGSYKWILDRGKVIERDENGKPLRVIGTHTDISKQKEKELELRKTLELYSAQNTQLTNFSHIVSHNLNAQAGNIKSILDLMEEEDDVLKKMEFIGHLRKVSNDLTETITHLSEIVSVQNKTEIEIKPLQLNYFIQRVNNILSTNIQKSGATIINNISESVQVMFNPAYLESVLLNLTSNAIKYAKEGRKPVIEFDFYTENNKRFLKVQDNGMGIDLEKYGKDFFGLYKTFHKNKNALGVGLYLTKSQIEAMKGSITVESKVDEGTRFCIEFGQ